MENGNKTFDLKVEKTIAKAPADVFRAISEGRLFMNCGADHGSLKIDFRVGGKYSIEFKAYGMKNEGEFLEIVSNQKIAFTWCQDYSSNPTPDTRVLIELKDLGGKTGVTVIHTGFSDLESKEAHQGGWTGGLEDLSQEIVNGKLRMIRKLPLTLEKAYETCKNPAVAFGLAGEVTENNPQQRIVFNSTGDSSKITLIFDPEDDNSATWLEVIHEGLASEVQQKSIRAKWENQLKNLM